MPIKPIPRAVLEERLRVFEELKAKHRGWSIRFGVYIMLVLGVIGSQALIIKDDLTLIYEPMKWGQLGGALIIAIFAYTKTEGDRVKAIDKRHPNVSRILMTALYNGFFWMTVVGVW